jgi:hypothetical protein
MSLVLEVGFLTEWSLAQNALCLEANQNRLTGSARVFLFFLNRAKKKVDHFENVLSPRFSPCVLSAIYRTLTE